MSVAEVAALKEEDLGPVLRTTALPRHVSLKLALEHRLSQPSLGEVVAANPEEPDRSQEPVVEKPPILVPVLAAGEAAATAASSELVKDEEMEVDEEHWSPTS